ncbi:MAG TPA: ribonuclease HII [Thermoanaerobaculia bacterium]|nr:ribonuclease HII [Thermoanaerobaculia bacterium]
MATLAQLIAETYRLRLLRGLDDLLEMCGLSLLAGVDEVGRGSLAGPVVAAAVIVDPHCLLPGVDDSKTLSAPQREELAAAIRATAKATAVAAIPAKTIDRVNILEATRMAMRKALADLHPKPDAALIDAVALDGLSFPCLPLVRGDAISYSVACASILAKVERDRMMLELDREFPYYGWAQNKGYGAPLHLAALAELGPTPVHRLTFRAVVPRRREGD